MFTLSEFYDRPSRMTLSQTPSTGLRHPSSWRKVPESDARNLTPLGDSFSETCGVINYGSG